MQPFNRALDGQLGAGLGDVFHGAFAPPGAVDAHHMRGEAALEHHPLALAPLARHVLAPDLAGASLRRGRSQTVSLELVGDPAAPEADYGSEVAHALDAALVTMPEGQRRVVLGRLIQGRSFADLGRELGMSEEACRMRFMRGLQDVREEFMKEGLEP